MRKKHRYLVVVAVCALTSVGALGQSSLFSSDTPGSRFRKYMNELQRDCDRGAASRRPGDTSCDILKLEPRQWDKQSFIKVEGQPLPVPASWVSTEEGRYAHSIKVPNPLPADSGYKKGMKSEEYFKLLCEKEAGEFVYKTVPEVRGFTVLRLRQFYKQIEFQHMNVIEDPYGHENDGAAYAVAVSFVNPPSRNYTFIEIPYGISPGNGEKVMTKVLLYGHEDRRDGEKVIRKWFKEIPITAFSSRYGVTWRGIVRPHDREHGIAGGELLVTDIRSGEVLAFRRGFARTNTKTGFNWEFTDVCPKQSVSGDRTKDGSFTYWFVKKALTEPRQFQPYSNEGAQNAAKK